MNKHKLLVKVKCMACGHKKGIFNGKSQKLYCTKCNSIHIFRTESPEEMEKLEGPLQEMVEKVGKELADKIDNGVDRNGR
jgi:hypothetical protein